MAAKITLEIQHNNFNVQASDIEKGIKALLKEKGIKQAELQAIRTFYVPATGAIHYNFVYADESKGCIGGSIQATDLLK